MTPGNPGLVPVRTGAKNIPTNNVEVALNCTLSAVGLLQDVRPPAVFKGPTRRRRTDAKLNRTHQQGLNGRSKFEEIEIREIGH